MPNKLTEKKWLFVPPQALTSNGTSGGDLQIAMPGSFRVGMTVQLSSNTQPTQNLEVKRIVDGVVSLGQPGSDPHNRTDISSFLVADAASLLALEQDRPRLGGDDVLKYVYEEEPTVALRTHLVDSEGEDLGTPGNPLNVAGGGGGGPGVPAALTYESILPLLANANFLNLANFERVSVSTVGTVNTLTYMEGGCEIANLVVDYTDPQNWSMTLSTWINDDDCSILLDDDGTPLLLD